MSRISDELRSKISRTAKHRCGYCLMPQEIIPMPLEIEHILAQAKGGNDKEENLWLACRACNSYKHAKTHGFDTQTEREVELFNPRLQGWKKHFEFNSETGEISGKTSCGRATVVALRLNEERAVIARTTWVNAGWYSPKD